MVRPAPALLLLVFQLPASEFHVATTGSDANRGSAQAPFRTISAAARAAQPGDTITVHAGTYRERVAPPRGGNSASRRITYQAEEGDEVWIKGSEVVKGWKRHKDGVWVLSLPKSYFKGYNPYTDLIAGDWFTGRGRPHHTGDVYLNGKALWEAASLERVIAPEPHPESRHGDDSMWTWYTTSSGDATYIYANFHDRDPNQETVEINVRSAVFYPDAPGRDYITVRGFRMAHAATQWAAPTAEQIGLIGTHWSKGWLIENNTISDSKCSCVTLGKDRATGHNVWTNNPAKDGATHYNEVVLRALDAGWSRDRVGSHVVRNNTIFNCEQAGIAGSLGAIHSRITGNHIHSIWRQRQFTGAEMGGIKLHGAIDVLIANNRIHDAGRGLWLDWMAQGTRVSANLFYGNTTDDLFVEVNHGPFVVDNNVFLSPLSLQDWSEGGAYVHNLFAGRTVSRPELGRWTPYHRAHSTAVAGVTLTKGGDNRFYNNIFLGDGSKPGSGGEGSGALSGYGTWVYSARAFPSQAAGNVYLNGAAPHAGEQDAARAVTDAKPRVVEESGAVYLLDAPSGRSATLLVSSETLGKTKVAELGFDDYDGAPLEIRFDYFGGQRSKRPAPGPFETVEPRLRVWR